MAALWRALLGRWEAQSQVPAQGLEGDPSSWLLLWLGRG